MSDLRKLYLAEKTSTVILSMDMMIPELPSCVLCLWGELVRSSQDEVFSVSPKYTGRAPTRVRL